MTLPTYVSLIWPDLTRDRPQLLQAAEVIGDWWDNGRTGDALNVSMPTRFGKSLLSTCFSVWLLLTDHTTRVLRASYASDLAESFSLQVQAQYRDFAWRYGLEVPKISGTRARWRIADCTQDNHIAVGVGGGLTGFGCDVAIIDDTAKSMLEATSAAYSKTLNSFRESVLLGRLEGRRKVLNVGTRWTVNDWFSYWPDAAEFVLPAMVDGHSVCEAWKTTAELELERSRVSDEVWNAQYMQRPTATGKVRLFEGWQPERVDPPGGVPVAVIDPATDYGRDYFVVGLYRYERGVITLCEMFARQRATIEEVAAWLKTHPYSVGWCETNGAGRDILAKLRQAGADNLAGFSTTKDKYSRAYVQMEDIRNHFRVSKWCNAEAVAELIREADAFPVEADGMHDDLIDNVVMAFERLLHR